MKRHFGKIKSTNQRCVVVFMQIPERTDHALVVLTDSLPPRFEKALMEVADGPDGQSEAILANVLGRRLVPDSGANMLRTLHEAGLLKAVPVDDVVMLPQPNMPFPLRQIIEGMGGSLPTPAPQPETADRFNPHLNNLQASNEAEVIGIARNLLVEAKMLEAEALAKRKKAYSYAPHLEAEERPAAPQVAVQAPKVRRKPAKKKVVAETAQ